MCSASADRQTLQTSPPHGRLAQTTTRCPLRWWSRAEQVISPRESLDSVVCCRPRPLTQQHGGAAERKKAFLVRSVVCPLFFFFFLEIFLFFFFFFSCLIRLYIKTFTATCTIASSCERPSAALADSASVRAPPPQNGTNVALGFSTALNVFDTFGSACELLALGGCDRRELLLLDNALRLLVRRVAHVDFGANQ
jgi:hypothetical protein